jgi:hypothetical protein
LGGKDPLKILLGKLLHFSNLPRNATCMSRGWQVEQNKIKYENILITCTGCLFGARRLR